MSQENTLQVVLITNGTASYTVFIYKCGDLEWERFQASIGFNADGTLFANHPLSGTNNEPAIACLDFPDSLWTNVFYALTLPLTGVTVSITTVPSGPEFPAAVWIDFTCNAVGVSFPDVLNYRWTVSCNATGSIVSVTEGNTNTIRVRSTPLVCSDVIECIVEDPVFQLAGSNSTMVTSVVGEFW